MSETTPSLFTLWLNARPENFATQAQIEAKTIPPYTPVWIVFMEGIGWGIFLRYDENGDHRVCSSEAPSGMVTRTHKVVYAHSREAKAARKAILLALLEE